MKILEHYTKIVSESQNTYQSQLQIKLQSRLKLKMCLLTAGQLG